MRRPAQVNQGNDTAVDTTAFTKPRYSQLPVKATRKRPVPVPDTFFASRGCRLTKASDVHARRKSLSPYLSFYCICLSLPADVLWGSFVTHLFLPHRPWGRNECVTNEPQRTSAGRLHLSWLLVNRKTFLAPSFLTLDQRKPIFQVEILRKRAGGEVTSAQGARVFPL